MEEQYKNIIENYEVSNFGNIRKLLHTGIYKDINCSISNKGYKYFQLQRNNKRINYFVHHLVCKAFIGERPDNLVIDHKDRNKLNNNINNLHYISQLENMRNTDKYLVHIEELEPKKRAIIRAKEYANKNKELVLENKKKYYQKNKENFKLYYQENKEKLLINKRKSYLKNKVEYSNKKKEKITCVCGKIISRGNLYEHKKSKYHSEKTKNKYSPENLITE